MIERIYLDIKNPTNSSIAFKGYKEYILKREGYKGTETMLYNEAMDGYIKDTMDNTIHRRSLLIDDYTNDTSKYEYLPMFLKNAVIGLHYKQKNPKERKLNSATIRQLDYEKKMPLIVNFNYFDFKHDPNPQVFIMHYAKHFIKNGIRHTYKTPIVEGFNLKYLTVSEIKKLLQLSIKFPNVDMYYFYHQVLKPYAISKATGLPLQKIRKIIAPYKKYPKGTWTGMLNFKGTLGKLNAYDIKMLLNDNSEYKSTTRKVSTPKLTGYHKTNNLLSAYRKYKVKKCTFYNIPLTLFNFKKEK